MINGLDLFSGIGGLSVALNEWVRPSAYCECDRYAQGVLLSRMQSGHISKAPIWDDVRTLIKELLPPIDIIYGGFPCQDISVAGNGQGLEGKRSGLFFEIIRLTKETRPTFVFLENVPALRTRGLREVIRAFTDIGYDCRWTCVSAAEVGAPHIRKRWFLLAHPNGSRLWDGRQWGKKGQTKTDFKLRHDGKAEPLADSKGQRLQSLGESVGPSEKQPLSAGASWWEVEPSVGRVVDGLPSRMDRLRGLGNAVVPLQAREAFMRLMGGAA